MKIAAIARIRNEEKIIKNTLDHVGRIVDEIYIYDDCSTDSTVSICKSHPKVKGVIQGKVWQTDPRERKKAEGDLRQAVYELSVKNGADWVYCFDADEYIEFENIDFTKDSYFFRLFDFYITEEDKDKGYLHRQWMGEEYREITMLFKVNPNVKFNSRVPKNVGKPCFGGWVKHYGKAISVEEWEKTCDYYINHRWKGVDDELYNRWKSRKGKAIHAVSSFGNKLIKWEDKHKGILMTKKIQSKSIYN